MDLEAARQYFRRYAAQNWQVSLNIAKTHEKVIFLKIVRKNAEISDDIWVDLGRRCSD